MGGIRRVVRVPRHNHWRDIHRGYKLAVRHKVCEMRKMNLWIHLRRHWSLLLYHWYCRCGNAVSHMRIKSLRREHTKLVVYCFPHRLITYMFVKDTTS
ncbi:hypothetical protein Hanom_Chr09g00870361 [Helianthus anomalus]